MQTKMSIYLSILFLVDVLFLPLITSIKSSITAPLVVVYECLHSLKRMQKERVIIFVFLGFSFLSVLISYVRFEDFFIENFIYFSLLVLFFLYYLSFKRLAFIQYVFVLKFLYLYFLFNVLLAVIFYFDHMLFFSIRDIWSIGSIEVARELNSTIRFTGLFSDPNNAAIVIVALYSMVTLYLFKSFYFFLMNTVLCLVIVVSSMSVTGFIAFFIAIILILLFNAHEFFYKKKIRILVLVAILIVLYLLFNKFVASSEVFTIAFDRVRDSSTDSRMVKFIQFSHINILDYIAFGFGGVILSNDSIFKPHIGHLHFVLNYGIAAYLIFLFIVFRLRSIRYFKYYIPVFILFLGFTVNTGFIDYRFIGVSSIILAVYVVRIAQLRGRGV